jgi:hypothetical protein|tara:strand:- start:431 stop:658 length:228 start_codon:yes stop_codon:yes gene_type:complete
MDFDDQIELEHLLFLDRKCRTCGVIKNLLNDFYRTRKDRTSASAYSYECKECTIKRISSNRKIKKIVDKWEYPDW